MNHNKIRAHTQHKIINNFACCVVRTFVILGSLIRTCFREVIKIEKKQ
nr:MAG TPA: hypothetical protein [Caudoviricetes sp.]